MVARIESPATDMMSKMSRNQRCIFASDHSIHAPRRSYLANDSAHVLKLHHAWLRTPLRTSSLWVCPTRTALMVRFGCQDHLPKTNSPKRTTQSEPNFCCLRERADGPATAPERIDLEARRRVRVDGRRSHERFDCVQTIGRTWRAARPSDRSDTPMMTRSRL